MIDPVTGWFEIIQYDYKIAITIRNLVEESFQLQMGFSFPFLCSNDLRSFLLIMRTSSFLLSCS